MGHPLRNLYPERVENLLIETLKAWYVDYSLGEISNALGKWTHVQHNKYKRRRRQEKMASVETVTNLNICFEVCEN